MDITTKFELGDEIWCISDHEIKKETIIDFVIKPTEVMKSFKDFPSVDIEYKTVHENSINEKYCFSSKDELIKQLTK